MPKPRRGSSGHDPAPEGIPRKLTERIARAVEELVEPDEAHLAHELRSWAASLPGTVLIAEAPLRTAVRVAGEVRRLIVRPATPFDELEAVLYDGSGEAWIVWLGRRSIPGVKIGSRLVVDGVMGEEDGKRRMIDPSFEFVPPPWS